MNTNSILDTRNEASHLLNIWSFTQLSFLGTGGCGGNGSFSSLVGRLNGSFVWWTGEERGGGGGGGWESQGRSVGMHQQWRGCDEEGRVTQRIIRGISILYEKMVVGCHEIVLTSPLPAFWREFLGVVNGIILAALTEKTSHHGSFNGGFEQGRCDAFAALILVLFYNARRTLPNVHQNVLHGGHNVSVVVSIGWEGRWGSQFGWGKQLRRHRRNYAVLLGLLVLFLALHYFSDCHHHLAHQVSCFAGLGWLASEHFAGAGGGTAGVGIAANSVGLNVEDVTRLHLSLQIAQHILWGHVMALQIINVKLLINCIMIGAYRKFKR